MFTKDMEFNDTSSNNNCATSAVDQSARRSSVEECNSANNSNGDSGYHSDLSGYHKASDYSKAVDKSSNSDPLAAMPNKTFGNEFRENISSVPTCTDGDHYPVTKNSSNPSQITDLHISNIKIDCDRLVSDSGRNEYLYSSKHYSDLSDGVKTTHDSVGAKIPMPLTCVGVYSTSGSHTLQSSPSVIGLSPRISCSHNHFSKSETVFSPTKQSELASRKNEEWKAIIHDLALKIEFCVMFGFTPNQIKTAITKLSYKASKNDILAELSSVQQNNPPLPPNTMKLMSSLDDINYNALGRGDTISHGAEMSQDSEPQARGPLSPEVEDENKAGGSDRSSVDDSENLRPIVIDGSNVAMSHGNKQYFSCKGILLAVDYFRNRNHRDITVFVPNYRKELPRSDALVTDREILDKLEEERILVYTPSRHINGKRITCYDDRFILRLAQETEGVIVSNDNFRDLQNEKPEWKELVEKRLLMYSFASDRFMPPDDPLGRNGPSIDNFLRKRPAVEEQNKPQCPYGKKCTFGKKCKYFHPECSRPVSERMKEKSEKRLKASSESIELAFELTHLSRTHNPSMPGNAYIRENAYSNEPRVQEDIGQSQHGNPQARWKIENERQRRMPSSAAHDNSMFNRSQGNGRVFPGSIPNESPYNSNPAFPNQSVRSDAYRYMGSPNHYSVAPKLPMPCSHANSQSCYDTQNPKYQYESARVGYQPSSPYAAAEPGPPDFHLENKSSYSNGPSNQPYQRSSPANLQMFDRANSGNGAIVQRQHMNLVPYSVAYQMPANPVYQSGYGESHFQPNQHLMHSYPVPHSRNSNPNIRHNMMNPSPYFVASINSTGSNSSLSHSYPFVAPEKSVVSPSISQHSLTNSSTGSDSKTYPPRAPRGYAAVQTPEPHQRQPPFVNPAYGGAESSARHQGRVRASDLPLSNPNNPRYNLFKNLCGLFQRQVVESVMNSHPEIRDPKLIVQMCLQKN